MKSSNTSNRKRRAGGFSMLEMTIVVAIMMIMASVSFMSLQPAIRQQRVIKCLQHGPDDDASGTRQRCRAAHFIRGHVGFDHESTQLDHWADHGIRRVAATYEVRASFRREVQRCNRGYPPPTIRLRTALERARKRSILVTPHPAGVGGQNKIYFCPGRLRSGCGWRCRTVPGQRE